MSATDKVRASIAEEAAEWFVANRHGVPDSAQQATFAGWLKTSPVHIEEYLGVALVAQDLRQAAEPGVSVEELVAEARSADGTTVRPIATDAARAVERASGIRWHLAAAGMAMVAAATVALLWWRSDSAPEVRYATRHGEQLTQRLPDNSVLRLDTDTAVTVRYSRTQRRIEVSRGQVLIEAAHDAGRPFRVVAGPAEVVDVGTLRQRPQQQVAVPLVAGAALHAAVCHLVRVCFLVIV